MSNIAIDTARGALEGLRTLFNGLGDKLDQAVVGAGQIPVVGNRVSGLLRNQVGKDLVNLQVTTVALDNILGDLSDDTAPLTVDTFTGYLTRTLHALIGDTTMQVGSGLTVTPDSPTQLDVTIDLNSLLGGLSDARKKELKKTAEVDLAGNLGLGEGFLQLESQGKLKLDFGLKFDQLRFGHDSNGFFLKPNENGKKLLSVGVSAALQGTPGAAKSANVTGNAANDFISAREHTFANGDRVVLSDLEGGKGLRSGGTGTIYFVRDRTSEGFKLSTSETGTARVNIEENLTAGKVTSAGSLTVGRSNHTGTNADFLSVAGHAFANGDLVVLSGLAGGQGLTNDTRYFVVNADRPNGRFKLAASPGGAAIDFRSDITAGSVQSVFNVTAKVGPLQFEARDKTVAGVDAELSLGVKLAGSADQKLRDVSAVLNSLSPVLTSKLDLDLGLEARALSFLPKLSADLEVSAGGTPASMTGDHTRDRITVPNNTFANGDAVIITELPEGQGSGLFADAALPYFVRSKDGDHFQLAATPGGSVVNFTSDISGGKIEARQKSGAPVKIDLKNVGIDLGSFLGEFVGKVVGPVKEVTKIVRPVTDALTTPIPPLVEAQSPVTDLVGIAKRAGFIEPADESAIRALADVVRVVDSLPVSGQGKIILGSVQDILGPQPKISGPPTSQPNNPVLQEFNTKNSGLAGGGLQFPILTDVGTALKLLKNQPADLFTYTLPKLEFSMRPEIRFPVANPFGIPLSAKFGGELGVKARISVGYDTKGLIDLAGARNPTAGQIAGFVADGLYISDNRTGGLRPEDLAEVEVKGALTVAGGLDAGFASAYIGGGIDASVELDLNDPDNDGKFRLSNVNLQNLGANFNYAGKISAFAFLEGHAGPIKGKVELGRVKLVEFANSTNNPQAITPGRVVPPEYLLNVGPLASQSGVTTRDSAGRLVQDEKVTISKRVTDPEGPGFEDVVINYATATVEFQRIRDRMRGDFGAGNDELVTPNGLLDKLKRPVHVTMGDGNDLASGGDAADSLVGGNGDDELTGFGGADTLLGGAGDDVLLPGNGTDRVEGGAGRDKVSYIDSVNGLGAPLGIALNFTTGSHGGAAAKDVFVSIEQFEGSQAADTIAGGVANEVFEGGRGNDRIDGGGGNDALAGGGGADTLNGGVGRDTANYAAAEAGVNISLTAGTGRAREQGTIATDSLSSIEDVIGSAHNDTLVGSADGNLLVGLGGIDSLVGGLGDDTFVVDNVGDQVSDVILARVGGSGGIQGPLIPFAGGIDTVMSSVTWNLGSNLENLVLTDSVASESPQVPRPNWAMLLSSADSLFKPFTGDVLVVGSFTTNGTGNELANRITGTDRANRLAGLVGNDTLLGQSGNDTLEGGEGSDSLVGGAGNDVLRGCVTAVNGGRGEIDTLTGGAGNDVFQLGFATGRFYDDGVAANAGRNDYALITDFTVGQDRLQLGGSASNYRLGDSGLNGVAGTGLFIEQGATDELIAVIRTSGTAPLAISSNTVNFV